MRIAAVRVAVMAVRVAMRMAVTGVNVVDAHARIVARPDPDGSVRDAVGAKLPLGGADRYTPAAIRPAPARGVPSEPGTGAPEHAGKTGVHWGRGSGRPRTGRPIGFQARARRGARPSLTS